MIHKVDICISNNRDDIQCLNKSILMGIYTQCRYICFVMEEGDEGDEEEEEEEEEDDEDEEEEEEDDDEEEEE